MKYRKAMHAPAIQAAANSDWELARSIQVTPRPFEGDAEHAGVLVARPHPTGWFVSARCRPELARHEVVSLQAIAARKAYLLFQEGPDAGSWTTVSGGQEWHSFVEAADAHDPLDIPETIPSQWAA